MDLQHINVKIYVEGELQVDPARFIELFHQWIQKKSVAGLLIDVADYRHVPSGPGVMLIGHEADYSMDNSGNRFGLLYNRKSPLAGSNADRFGQALWCAANACRLLENEFDKDGSLKFSRQEFELFVNDRALAPNTTETFEACKPELESFLETVLGHDKFSFERYSDPRSRFGVTVRVATPFDLATLLEATS